MKSRTQRAEVVVEADAMQPGLFSVQKETLIRSEFCFAETHFKGEQLRSHPVFVILCLGLWIGTAV